MKRKRFEKLMMGRYGKAPRDLRDAVRTVIEIRRCVELDHNVYCVYDKNHDVFRAVTVYPYKEMLERIEAEKPVISYGIEMGEP